MGPTVADPVAGLVRKLVTRCALARVCGSCGEPLGRPIAFVGTIDERDRNAFHFPPLHVVCADELRSRWADLPADGQAGQEWIEVLTAGFEFVRPGADDEDRRPTFQPNSLL